MADALAEKRTDFLTARQLADHLQVSETTVHRMRRRGRIPFIRVTDRIVRFNLKDVRHALVRASAKRAEPEDLPDTSAQMEFADLLAEFEAQ